MMKNPLDISMASSRRPSWVLEKDKDAGEDESESYRIESKLCEDIVSAFKIWDNHCIVDAYFN